MRIDKLQGEFLLERVIDSPRIIGIQLTLVDDNDEVVEAMLLSEEALDSLAQEKKDELTKLAETEESDPLGYWNKLKEVFLDGSGSNEEVDPGRNDVQREESLGEGV